MPKGELFINGNDAYDKWGISLMQGGLTALMTPPPAKSLPENESRLRNGKEFVKGASRKVADRDVTLQIQLTAPDETTFFTRYASFCEELRKGSLDIRTKYQNGVVYHLEYLSCTQFEQFIREYASFSLKLNEPDPANRN